MPDTIEHIEIEGHWRGYLPGGYLWTFYRINGALIKVRYDGALEAASEEEIEWAKADRRNASSEVDYIS